MSIIRTPLSFDNHYTIMPNAWARDARLTLKARGLLLQLLSHSVGWEITIESLVRANPEGREAIRTAILELEKHGYLTRDRARTDGGQLAGMNYVLTEPAPETPTSENPTQAPPASDFPTLAEPTQEKPYVGKPGDKEEHLQEDHPEEDHLSGPAASGAGPEAARPELDELAEYLADRVEANGHRRPKLGKTAREETRKLIDIDKRTPAQVRWMIDWATRDPFWWKNIRSMEKLREHFDTMLARSGALPGPQDAPVALSAREQENQAFLARRRAERATRDRELTS